MHVLIVGCGPSGEDWYTHHNGDTTLIACNSAIVPLAKDADMFMCLENLGWANEGKGDVGFPWIHTETDALKVIDQKNLEPERFKQPMVGNIQPIPRDNIRPMTYPQIAVGTVLADALKACIAMDATEVHSIGFPLYLTEGKHHWTEEGNIYTPGCSFYMQPEVFVKVRYDKMNWEPRTIWQWAMSAAWLKSVEYPFKWIDHSKGLLQIPGIEKLVKHMTEKPRDLVV